MRAILDTSVLVAGGTGALDGDLAISVVSIAEIHFGVLAAPDDTSRAERLELLTGILGAFEPLPVDEAVAASWGRLAAAVRSVPRNPRSRSMDLLIAATAHAHDARLYTYNRADFVGIEGLVEVVDLGQPPR